MWITPQKFGPFGASAFQPPVCPPDTWCHIEHQHPVRIRRGSHLDTNPFHRDGFRTNSFSDVPPLHPDPYRGFQPNARYKSHSFSADSNAGNNLLSVLGGSVTSNLPSKQEMAQLYAEAIVAFWVVGGIALFLVSKFGSPKSR